MPHKNILKVGGKPLICYSIEVGLAAVKNGTLDELVVSTDDQEIAEISLQSGVSVPFLRPASLSGDHAKSVDVMIHAYQYYVEQGRKFDAIMLLQPTAPLRTASDIDGAIDVFLRSGASSLISCYREEYISDLVSYHKAVDMAVALNSRHNSGGRRQDEPDLYVRNGAIYITNAERMMQEHTVFGNSPAMYVMPKERSVNIDTMDDVEYLEWILSK